MLAIVTSGSSTTAQPQLGTVVISSTEDGLAHVQAGYHLTTYVQGPQQDGSRSDDLLYATYYGGPTWEMITDVAIDAQDNMYVVGTFDTGDPNLGWDVFVAKFGSDGSRIWSTVFGGIYTDQGTGIDVDPQGNVYVCGLFTNDWGVQNSFVAKLNSDGSQFLWRRNIPSMPTAETLATGVAKVRYRGPWVYYSGFLTVPAGPVTAVAGGVGRLNASDGSAAPVAMVGYYFPPPVGLNMEGVAAGFDQLGNAYFVNRVMEPSGRPVGTWAAKIDLNYFQFPLWTYSQFGSPSDPIPTGLRVDALSETYVVGYTRTDEGSGLLSVMKLGVIGRPIYSFTSPVLEGGLYTEGHGIAVDAQGRVYVSGFVTDSLGNEEVFLARLTPGLALDTLIFGGAGHERGLALAAQLDPGRPTYAVVAGLTNSDIDFPVTPDAFQQTYGGGENDGFLARARLPGA